MSSSGPAFDGATEIDDEPVDPPRRPGRIAAADAGLVIVGGTVGTAARYLITRVGSPGLAPTSIIMMINTFGCLVLGVLLELLALGGADRGRRRMVRLTLGTGALGGFTTYSTFSVGVRHELASGQLIGGVGYGLGSVLAGIVAAAIGVWFGTRIQRAARRALNKAHREPTCRIQPPMCRDRVTGQIIQRAPRAPR